LKEYGTMNIIQYLGTPKKLPLLRQGDVVIGEAGFQKGRSIVLVEAYDKCTTNAHGLCARRDDGDLVKSIFFRCIFNWYRNARLVDIMGVGGSGGHLSPSYFDDYIRIPRVPRGKQEEIASLYHNPVPEPETAVTLDGFVDLHRQRNENLGIWELDGEMKSLTVRLHDVQEHIINGESVAVPLV
jgi:hypothetical protein